MRPDMVRINLLPREITEKRKFENAIVYVFVVAGVLVVLIVAVWLILFVQVQGKRDLLQTQEQRASIALQTAEDYRIFEEREESLRARSEVAKVALAQRIDWGRLTNELSLVLPSDTWLDRLRGTEAQSADEDPYLRLEGGALDSPLDIPDMGFKSVAKTLARLAELEQITDVWLGNAARNTDDEKETTYIQFVIEADVVLPDAPATGGAAASSVPPPPNSTGQ
ncbi:MAG: PilN domain-containing protein [Coriobacteriia bacterium]|nr:PilN domain-containing protein [Coriobacteriia bacterium]